jgi:hypothetical protein
VVSQIEISAADEAHKRDDEERSHGKPPTSMAPLPVGTRATPAEVDSRV